jgi:tRNA uridine 5-carboxymethylaminomethyl modification enzyme
MGSACLFEMTKMIDINQPLQDKPILIAPPHRVDVVVIGGGHAGCEAAAAAARAGARTVLVTADAGKIGEMSCNPAIGGLGKGHMVREIDALDGVMGRVADYAGIQFRLLNRSRGPAVRGPRAQADRALYRSGMQHFLAHQAGLDVVEASVDSLVIAEGVCTGVKLETGEEILAQSVVLTTGTFLRGMIHLGKETWSAGRMGEKATLGLAAQLDELGLAMGRLKTGTPARLDGATINYDACEQQPGDVEPYPFSFLTDRPPQRQIPCWITWTTAETHQIIRDNLHENPMYAGAISGRGPRYCPSIEDKIVRFADKERHQIFLEPEGLDDQTIYPNGISTSFGREVQEHIIRSIPGLERVGIKQWAYAIEYDFVDPRALDSSLMVQQLPGLFLAGQINGTTGYEEAAGQGLVAGLNAARRAHGLEAVSPDRSMSYIGVMIDDLISRGVTEPYRMFTSRAEYRLRLRADNADQRLTPFGIECGIVGPARAGHFKQVQTEVASALLVARQQAISPAKAAAAGFMVKQDGRMRTALDLLGQPDVSWAGLVQLFPDLANASDRVREQLEVESVYSGFLQRQEADVLAFKRDEDLLLPVSIDYSLVGGLSSEVREKLSRVRPATLGQAGRIEGMTPGALTALLAYVRRGESYGHGNQGLHHGEVA